MLKDQVPEPPATIGELAVRSRLSYKALRYYAELGLSVPDHVDPVTGYRWYVVGQLERARLWPCCDIS